jgi:hypothetical protein
MCGLSVVRCDEESLDKESVWYRNVRVKLMVCLMSHGRWGERYVDFVTGDERTAKK